MTTRAQSSRSGGRTAQPPKPKPKPQPVTAAQRPRVKVIYDEIPDDDVFTLDVSGEKGVGKTHLACSFPKTLALLDTEKKGYTVAKKFKDIRYKQVNTFDDVRQVVLESLDDDEVQTVAIDTGAMLVGLAGREWNAESGKNYRWPISNYQFAYAKIDELFLPFEDARKYFVSTSRMKDEYIGEVNTGRRIRDGYKKFPWTLSLNVHLSRGIKIGSKVHYPEYVFGKVTKSNFQGLDHRTGLQYCKPWLFECTYEGIKKELLNPWGDGVPSHEADKVIVEQAKEWIEQFRK